VPFQNPIVGGTALVRPAINSPNYVAGVSGWAIKRDGSAEFASAVLRGEVDIGPASPNPRIIITSTIPATLAAASADFSWTSVKLMYFDATQYYFEAIGNFVGTGGPFSIYANGTYDSTNGVMFNQFQEAAGAPASLTLLYGSSTYNAQPLVWAYRHGTISLDNTTTLLINGAAQAVGITATQGGGIAEVWHPLSPLLAGWTNYGAPEAISQYRKVPSPINSVEVIVGALGGTTADGTTIATLPVGYRPAHIVHCGFTTSVSGARSCQLRLSPSGNLDILGVGAGGDLTGTAFFSLDA
jgi:hypothetical protein